MTTFNASNTNTTRPHEGGRVRIYTLPNIIDLSVTSLFGAGATNADVIKLITIPAGITVIGFGVDVLTVGNAGGTMDIGITGDDTDGFGAAFALDATAPISKPSAAGYYVTGGYFFETQGTIDGLLVANLGANGYNTGEFLVRAVCIDYNRAIA